MSQEPNNWRPSANIENIMLRSKILRAIREFFYARNVMEVETPLLSTSSGTDIHLQPLIISRHCNKDLKLFLQTSPEFFMKRLLACNAGSIFQICKAFRDDEIGGMHNLEFTMLEWYQVNYSLELLMQEVYDLLVLILGQASMKKIAYSDLFQQHFAINPHNVEHNKLLTLVRDSINIDLSLKLTRDELLDLLLTHIILPKLTPDSYYFIFDFPKTQAALAQIRLDQDNNEVARRFEVYINGIELANGYHELLDPVEQEKRFLDDIKYRAVNGLIDIPMDYKLLQALKSGIPECAGVALGLDRLIMLKARVQDISAVIAFPYNKI